MKTEDLPRQETDLMESLPPAPMLGELPERWFWFD